MAEAKKDPSLGATVTVNTCLWTLVTVTCYNNLQGCTFVPSYLEINSQTIVQEIEHFPC